MVIHRQIWVVIDIIRLTSAHCSTSTTAFLPSDPMRSSERHDPAGHPDRHAEWPSFQAAQVAQYSAGAHSALPFREMTAKEELGERIETLSEEETGEALRLLDLRVDPVIVAFRDAAPDDGPWTEEDEAAAAEGRGDLGAGRAVSLD